MALAGEITRELSPIRSWSNKDYDLKLAEKARERELQVREAMTADTFPLTRPAGAPKILVTPAVRSRVHEYTWAWVYFFITTKRANFLIFMWWVGVLIYVLANIAIVIG